MEAKIVYSKGEGSTGWNDDAGRWPDEYRRHPAPVLSGSRLVNDQG